MHLKQNGPTNVIEWLQISVTTYLIQLDCEDCGYRRMTRQVDIHTTARESYGEDRVEIETYLAESWKKTVIKNNINLCMYVCMYINILVSDGNPPNVRYPYLKVKASQTMVWLVWFTHVTCELSISRWSD